MTTGSNVRSFTYLGSGQASKDIRDPSNTYTFTANKDGQQQTATLNGTDVGTYTYNGLRQRASKSSGGLLTKYLYDLSGHLIAETNNATAAVVKEYLWLDDMPVAVVDDTGASPVLSYIQTDHLGTPQKITDGSAAVVWDGAFDPFGNAASITASITNNLRFPGQYFDAESGLNQNWNRDYDPTIGRYIESDPIGILGGVNTYAYVLGNPLRNIDPEGRGVVGGVLGAIVGGLGGAAGGTAVEPIGGTAVGGYEGAAEGYILGSELEDFLISLPKVTYKPNCDEEPDCNEEWEHARDFCDKIAAENGYGSGWSVGGRNYRQCVLGQVSELCGGNAVDRGRSPRNKH